MSLLFLGVRKRDFNITNGAGFRLLSAMGYSPIEETCGQMPLKDALAGIERARKIVSEEDRPFLEHLAVLCAALKKARRKELTWC